MNYIVLTDNAARQVIDSTSIFDEFVRVKARAQPYAGGMYWKRQGDSRRVHLAQTRAG